MDLSVHTDDFLGGVKTHKTGPPRIAVQFGPDAAAVLESRLALLDSSAERCSDETLLDLQLGRGTVDLRQARLVLGAFRRLFHCSGLRFLGIGSCRQRGLGRLAEEAEYIRLLLLSRHFPSN